MMKKKEEEYDDVQFSLNKSAADQSAGKHDGGEEVGGEVRVRADAERTTCLIPSLSHAL